MKLPNICTSDAGIIHGAAENNESQGSALSEGLTDKFPLSLSVLFLLQDCPQRGDWKKAPPCTGLPVMCCPFTSLSWKSASRNAGRWATIQFSQAFRRKPCTTSSAASPMTAYNQHFIHRLPIPLLDPLIFHSFQFHLLACKDFQSPVYLPNSFTFKMWPLPLFSPCWAGMNGWLRNITFIDRLIRATVYLQSPLILNSPESTILLPPLYQWRNRIKGLGNPMVTQLLVLRQSFCPSSHLLFLFWCRPPGTSHAPAAPRARWSQGMVKSHRNFFVACAQIHWYSKHLMPSLGEDLRPCPIGSSLDSATWFCQRNMSKGDVFHSQAETLRASWEFAIFCFSFTTSNTTFKVGVVPSVCVMDCSHPQWARSVSAR